MTLLRWAPAEREHEAALRQFRCTPKGRRVKRFGQWHTDHPAPHELRVQALVGHHLAPVGDPYRTVLLGWDDQGLGGVTTYRNLGSSQFAIDVIAVALRLRRPGRSGYGREALVTTLDYITTEAHGDGYNIAQVAADIHEDNAASRRLFEIERFGITDIREDGYQVWAADLLIEGAGFEGE